jgi:predicted transcriptional regulator
MATSTAKQMAVEAVQQLPDDATLEDAMERLYLLQRIARGLADATAGRTVSHEDVVQRFELRFAQRAADGR